MSWLTSIGDVVGAAFGFPGAGSAVGALFGDSSSFAAPALSGALDFFGQSSANNVNKDIAALNNSTALDLANTAHQREVKDLIAAGLNPMLSAKLGGAQVPQLQQARVENAAGRGVSSAMAAREMQARITNLEEQNNKLITLNLQTLLMLIMQIICLNFTRLRLLELNLIMFLSLLMQVFTVVLPANLFAVLKF